MIWQPWVSTFTISTWSWDRSKITQFLFM